MEPPAGKSIIPCPYCETAVSIPENLRTKDLPATSPSNKIINPYFIPPLPREGDDISDVLSQVQPLASGALKVYGIWAMLRMLWRRILPVCAVIAMVFCLLICAASILVIFLSQRGG